MKRQLNQALFKASIKATGEFALEKLAYESRVSISTLKELLAGTYPAQPKEKTRERICAALGVSEDILFPLVIASENKKPTPAKNQRRG